MKKIMYKLLKFAISRGIYVVLGAILAVTCYQGQVKQHEYIAPDFDEGSDCVDFYEGEETMVGHVCQFDNGFVYVYLPVNFYAQHLIEACAYIFGGEEKEEERKKKGRWEIL